MFELGCAHCGLTMASLLVAVANLCYLWARPPFLTIHTPLAAK